MNKEQLLKFIPDIKEIQESPLLINGKESAYNSSVVLENGYCIGSGFALSASMSRQIALFEAVERKAFYNLFNNGSAAQKERLLLNEYPTSCGFSTGADVDDTKNRAIAEAVERWIRSKWIDDSYKITEISIDRKKMTDVESYYSNQFNRIRVFANSCKISVGNKKEIVNSVIVVGLNERGAFVGSKSTMNAPAPLLPALVEAWRHLILSQRNENQNPDLAIIKYFAEHREKAEEQMSKAHRAPLPDPELRILEQVEIPIDGIFCFRALCKDFQGWHGPDITRFVY